MAKPSFFITTPIYYVNAKPHLGTAYSTVLCDVEARYRRATGYDVKFLTGMDEHGEKVAEAAAAHGMTPQEWCDSQAPFFKDLWRQLEISNDDFIRTTEQRQHDAVQYLWERMKESGYLYKGSYDGWYCVPEETYFTETQVTKSDEEHHTEGQHLCPDCGRPLERVQEESYFFKLSAFQDRLLKLYDEHPDFVQPDFRMNEVRSFVEGGLQDLSVSRTSFDWGIPVPFDEKHVTYVWFDALLNYMTAVGYGVDTPEAKAELAYRWPAQYHVVGKDIIRFHCVIWPAMLMAIGEALPEHVFAHGFLMVRNEETGQGEKMSKSRGNVINPNDVVAQYGADTMRLYIMFIGDFEKAAAWSDNAVKGCKRFLDRVWNLAENLTEEAGYSKANESAVHKTIKKVSDDIEAMKFNTAIAALMALVNDFYQNGCSKGDYAALLLMLSPFAPHMVEELWETLGFAAEKGGMACAQPWPAYDASKTMDAEVNMAVQVCGKLRGTITVPADSGEEAVVAAALADPKVQKFTEGKKLVKTILVPNKLVNLIAK